MTMAGYPRGVSTGQLPSFARAWLLQRNEGASAVAAVEHAELRALDEEEALRQSDALLAVTPMEGLTDERKTNSGLAEQQRLFALSRK